jgi:hypothetical protein
LPNGPEFSQQDAGLLHSMRELMTGIDWATELRKIERQYDGLPPEPTPKELNAKRAAERREFEILHDRALRIGAWGRAILVVALATAINFWPYFRDCGVGLFAYVGAESVVVLGGLWMVVWTWSARMPRAHMIAVAMTLWGMGLLADQALPRIGYARVPDPANPPGWLCAAPAGTSILGRLIPAE